MSVLRRLTLLTLPFFVTACGAEESQEKMETPAQQVAPAAKQNFDEAALKAKFSKLGVSILDIQPSDVAGLLEIQTNGGVLFASNDGSHFIAGTLYAIDNNGGYKDVIAERQAPLNAEKIAKFSDSVIEYKADNEKYVVTVFTDITCGYCVRLHSQMQGYNVTWNTRIPTSLTRFTLQDVVGSVCLTLSLRSVQSSMVQHCITLPTLLSALRVLWLSTTM